MIEELTIVRQCSRINGDFRMENKVLGKGLSALISKKPSESILIKKFPVWKLIHLGTWHMLKQFPFWRIDFSQDKIMMNPS